MTASEAQPNTPNWPSRKVLILVRAFVPYYPSLGGVIRMIKLANYLVRQGYEVFVVAAKGKYISDFGYAHDIAQLKITYYTDKAQEQYSRKYASTILAATKPCQYQHLIDRLLQLAKMVLIPDPGILFVLTQYLCAKRIIETESISHIIVSSPAHSSQLAGWLLKRHFGKRINLIVDYRDSWNCTDRFMPRGRIGRFISRRMEAAVLRSADHLTYVSAPMLSKLNASFFDVSSKASMIMNGYDLAMKAQSPATHTSNPYCVTLGYFGRASDAPGSVNDPTNLFRAIKSFSGTIRLAVYGPVLLQRSPQQTVSSAVSLHGSIEHTAALREMARMDVLVMLYTGTLGSDEVVSGKIFDYMLAGRPILVIGPKNMEARRIILEKGIGYWADCNSLFSLQSTLETIYDDWRHDRLHSYPLEYVAEFDRDKQNSKFLPLLG